MMEHQKEIRIPTVESIRLLLQPIYQRLADIQSKMSNEIVQKSTQKYYRNGDLKNIFNLSNNTIVKYRETGVIPYTKMGDIYLYEVKAIDTIIKENSVNIDRL
ncbi:DNA-binding protein [Psychroserpens jangbogonensis]|uniref:DNA-binding protein n=1 Tax=Psychroserpens jangbogonensis TaxID=1484460 RepID=UPI00053D92B5|nr:DNA-binding protein [Psychroserpens jangbogonensis]